MPSYEGWRRHPHVSQLTRVKLVAKSDRLQSTYVFLVIIDISVDTPKWDKTQYGVQVLVSAIQPKWFGEQPPSGTPVT